MLTLVQTALQLVVSTGESQKQHRKQRNSQGVQWDIQWWDPSRAVCPDTVLQSTVRGGRAPANIQQDMEQATYWATHWASLNCLSNKFRGCIKQEHLHTV